MKDFSIDTFLFSGILHDQIANTIYKIRSMTEDELDYYVDQFLVATPVSKFTPEMKAKIIEFIWTVKHASIP